MNILIINWQDISNPMAGGAEVHLHEIFKRIAAMGHQITLLCCEYNNCKKNENIDGINIIRKGKRNFFNFIVPSEYKRLIKQNSYDIVIDDINKIPFYTPFFVKLPLLVISHHFFGKSIFNQSGIIAGSYVYITEKIIDLVYKKQKFTVVSQSTLDEFIERGFNKDNFTIIPNAIDHNLFPFKAIEKAEPNITYFGRLKKYKSVDHIVHAFSKLAVKYPDLKLNIAGTGDFRGELENIVAGFGLSKRVKFWGFITDEQKLELLSNSYCVINPSIKEGWGITNIEANACGTPVISSNVPGLRDSVLKGESGFLYEYGNIDDMVSKISLILDDNELRNKINSSSIDWAKKFDWDKSAGMMEELIEQVVRNK